MRRYFVFIYYFFAYIQYCAPNGNQNNNFSILSKNLFLQGKKYVNFNFGMLIDIVGKHILKLENLNSQIMILEGILNYQEENMQ
jgi:hypothetical protein